MSGDTEGLRERAVRQGEEALGKVAEELFSNPVVRSAIGRAFGAREKAVAAQETAMGALNLPSAADLERLTRRIRGVSQRLEAIEDLLDRLATRMEKSVGAGGSTSLDDRLARIESQLQKLTSGAPGSSAGSVSTTTTKPSSRTPTKRAAGNPARKAGSPSKASGAGGKP